MIQFGILLMLAVFSCGSPVDRIAKELDQLGSRAHVKNVTEGGNRHQTLVIEEASLVKNWPSEQILDYVGQISGISFCPKGFLFVFQRGDREMDERSFDTKNRFTRVAEGPIRDSTILKINNKISEPDVVDEFGDNMFYIPHGIFADKTHVWTTDVALHQVFRFPHGSKKPDLILGEKFIPGNDDTHFCKPSHAVTASDGSIFVADGYCNSRIVKFDKSGKLLMQFGDQKGEGRLNIPHHLALIETKNLICVADRENNRVMCFNAGLDSGKDAGKLVKVIVDTRFGLVFALGYNALSNILYIVSGMSDKVDRSRVFLYNWDNDVITGAIDYPSPNGFGMAHSISVCSRQKCLAIAGLTKECPADADTCIERAEDDQNYLPRNIWLYGLSDETVQLE